MDFTNKTFQQIFFETISYLERGEIEKGKEKFDLYIRKIILDTGLSVEGAVARAQSNFGYFAGYCSADVQRLVAKHLNSSHPIFSNNQQN